MLTNILILLGSLSMLGIAAYFLVGASMRLARLLKVSEAFIGLTIVAAGTSAPEIAVSVSAALDGKGALSVGNVIGSNIFNLGFILGLVALIAPQAIQKKTVYRDGPVLLGSTLLVLLFLWDQQVAWWEGVTLLAGLVAYNSYLWIKKDVPEEEEDPVETKPWASIGIFLLSLFGLIQAAEWAVEASVKIAESYGISEWAIGATIVAAGTSLPEIATSVMATIRRRFALSIGNVIGSDIFNVFGIIGVSSVVAPIRLSSESIFGLPDNIVSVILLIATILLVLVFMRTKWTLSRVEGGILLLICVARMGFELGLGR